MFIDEILELFGGADGDYLMEHLTYKELIARRNARVKRKNKEIEDEQKFREEELKAQQRASARSQILR
jgi:DNA-binding response OmpR family regulator